MVREHPEVRSFRLVILLVEFSETGSVGMRYCYLPAPEFNVVSYFFVLHQISITDFSWVGPARLGYYADGVDGDDVEDDDVEDDDAVDDGVY